MRSLLRSALAALVLAGVLAAQAVSSAGATGPRGTPGPLPGVKDSAAPAAPAPAVAVPSLGDLLGGKGIDLKISGQLPGEQAYVATLQFLEATRASMDPELVKRLDAVAVQQAEDLQKVWRGLWIALGVLKP